MLNYFFIKEYHELWLNQEYTKETDGHVGMEPYCKTFFH